MAYQPSPSVAGSSLPPLSRPQLAEARRVRAVELFEGGVSHAEIARAVGVCAESVRRWRRVWEQDGASGLRRRAATGRPPKLDELNPVELLWSSLKKRELANLAGDHLADVADTTEQGIHRINANPRLPWSFLAHTGLTIHPPHPPNLRKDQ
ncbi:helix-turn-helix domain-containing protein [Streptomyces sp. NPDC005423]|uniref:helix-turn-helix domain-containing protein n=1 Tax=Streptomyces sp. NPDC005423 TaxID=3155343 RepID=UPI0033B3B750